MAPGGMLVLEKENMAVVVASTMTRLYFGKVDINEKEKLPGGAYPGVSLRSLRVIGGPSGRSKGRLAARQVVAKASTRLRV